MTPPAAKQPTALAPAQPAGERPADAVPPRLDSLPSLRVDGRMDRLRSRLAGDGIDAAVITAATNVAWLTGFGGSNGTVVVTVDGAVLVTDSRYADQAPEQLEAAGCDAEVVIAGDPVPVGAERFGAASVVGLEATIAWGEQKRWAAATTAELTPMAEVVEELRAVKDPAELARIEAAAVIADEALEEIRPRLRAGVSEIEIQRGIDDAIRARGATGPAYDTIVASGPNSALPHARPTGRELAPGDLVIIDAGAVVEGYRSDMTRTFVVGEPSAETADMIELVARAQAAGVAAVRPGAAAGAVDDACRSVIDEAGFGAAFIHGTGHGVGLDIHELPRVRSGATAILRPGHVLTVEPGVYVSGVGGVRVEDSVVVTAGGCRALTRHPKDPRP